jgi:Na+/H+ antiporter NhaD/arsenite permease-like protein
MNIKAFLLILFFITYLVIIVSEKIQNYIAKITNLRNLKIHKSVVIWLAIILLILLNAIKIKNIVGFVNWDIILLFLSTMTIAEAFIISNIPSLLALKILKFSRSNVSAIILLSAFAGFISVFCDNVATVLIMTPIAFEVARKIDTSPIPFVISIAISSNLQGAALLIGDPPSMILASFNKMKFMDFIFYQGKPSMFFAMEIAAVVSLIVLYIIFRKNRSTFKFERTKIAVKIIPGIILILFIITIASGILSPGKTALIYAIISAIWMLSNNPKASFKLVKKLDYDTVFFLIGIFIFTGALEVNGVISNIAHWFNTIGRGNLFLTYSILVWGSVVISAFIDNIPYVAAMMPVGIALAHIFGINQSLFLFGIVIGASVGGNITPIGASANIVGVGMLRKRKYYVNFMDFVKIGLPFTFFSVLAAYIFIWLIYT